MKGTVLNLQFRILCPSESPPVLAWATVEIDGFGSLFLYLLYFPCGGFLPHCDPPFFSQQVSLEVLQNQVWFCLAEEFGTGEYKPPVYHLTT